MKKNSKNHHVGRIISLLLALCMVLAIAPMTVFAYTDTEISIIDIENATLYYDAGDKPKATAEKFEVEGLISNYEIEYECWEEMETTESGEPVPIKFWYSDESQYTSSQQKITTFEVGKTYMYSISVKAEDGYSFADDYELYVNSVAQQSVIKTQNRLLITAITTIQPRSTQLQNISVVEINNATISFNVGDKPVFTGKTPDNAPYIYQCEWWETDEGKEGKHSTDFFDGGFERLITNFERGKTYNYGIYLKAAEGYCFTTDTKLKINGKYYDYDTNDYDPLLQYDNGGFATMWVHTDLTMTPTAAGETPNYKIIEGANGAWTQNSDGTLVFRANGDFGKFTGVKVDDTLIDAKNYTAVSGSTVITLKADYLKTLSVSTHKLTVVYTDGECSTDFEIKKSSAQQTDKTQKNAAVVKSPETGNDTGVALLVYIAFAGGVCVATLTVLKKKKVR